MNMKMSRLPILRELRGVAKEMRYMYIGGVMRYVLVSRLSHLVISIEQSDRLYIKVMCRGVSVVMMRYY